MRISDWSSDVCSSDLFLDQRLDWPRQVRVDLGRRLGWLVVNRPTRHTEPAAQLADRHSKAVVLESLLDRVNHAPPLPNRDYHFFPARSSNNLRRAALGERSCKSVKLSGVAESLKKTS